MPEKRYGLSMNNKWGNLKQIISQIAIYFTPVSWGMMFLTAWHTTIQPYLMEIGIGVPTWAAIISVIITVIIVGVVEWRYSMPSYFKSYNKALYTEDSPVMVKLQEIEKRLNERERITL
jgi:tetrahydromethanopterin S-methyltransferase subunit E